MAPAHAGKRRRDHEGQHDELIGIDAHQCRSFAVLRYRAQRLAEKGKFHKGVEQADGDRGHHDDQDALHRQEYADEADHVIAVGRIEGVGDRPEQHQHGVLQGDGDPDRCNQRQQFTAALAQGRKNDRVHQPSQNSPQRSTRPQYRQDSCR